jgi:hypothetical protein
MLVRSRTRRGASLTEVLVALVILTITLTSVIALFPVGVSRVRNAALDTRTTILAQNAQAIFHLKRMANDPALVDLAAYDVLTATLPTAASYVFDDPVRNPLAFTAWSPQPGGWAGPWGNPFPADLALIGVPALNQPGFYATLNLLPTWLPRNPGNVAVDWPLAFRERLLAEDDDVFGLFAGVPARTDVEDASRDFNYSYPVLLDPYLYDAMCFQFGLLNQNFYGGGQPAFTGGVPRINIATALTRSDGTPIPGFENYYQSLGPAVIRPFADIAVASLSEITLLPPAQISIDRETVKARWFSSPGDIAYSAEISGQPRNPSSQDFLDTTGTLVPLVPNNYIEPVPITTGVPPLPPSLANPIRPTAQRDYEYTWGAMIQRRLIPAIESPDPAAPVVARPNLSDREFKGKLAILCFYRRNLQQPYRVIEGCFYTGSKVATLSWPSNLPAPTISGGTWLCEASISRSTAPLSITGVNPDPLLGSTATLSGVYVDDDPTRQVDYLGAVPLQSAQRIYRRSYSFHRVVAVGEQVDDLNSGRSYVQVTLERPAAGFPLQYQNPATGALGALSGQDDRPIDAYPPFGRPGSGVNPTYTIPVGWPIVDRRNVVTPPFATSQGLNDETNCSQAAAVGLPLAQYDQYSFYYPVIIFDGLREVFEYNAE